MKTISLLSENAEAGPSNYQTSPHSIKAALRDVALSLVRSKRVVVVTGAGISCSAGIPDFRSENGLYSLVKARYPDCIISGKDLFSASALTMPATRPVFHAFTAELSIKCRTAQPTTAHHFLAKLHKKNKLLRIYTQNIDGLESRAGLVGKGKATAKDVVVLLHGDIQKIRCELCLTTYDMTEELARIFAGGSAPACPSCEDRCHSRMRRNARSITVGSLRSAIVLYDEPHPLGEAIGAIETCDLSKKPDFLLIMGTSLKVHGLKALIKDFANAVHATTGKRGQVVFVNKTPPSSEWHAYIDVFVQSDTDGWADLMTREWRRVKPTDWEVQSKLSSSPGMADVKSGDLTAAKPRKVLGDVSSRANRGQVALPLTPSPSPARDNPRIKVLGGKKRQTVMHPDTPPQTPRKKRQVVADDVPETPSKRRSSRLSYLTAACMIA